MKIKTLNVGRNRLILDLFLASFVRFFDLKGSWKWTVKEMKKGNC